MRPDEGDPPGAGGHDEPPLEQFPAYGESYPDYPADDYPPRGFDTADDAGLPGPAGSGRTHPLAILSLALSLTGVFCLVGSVAGILLGALALNQIKRSGQRGYGLAVAGIVVGVAGFAITLIWMIYTGR